jgi:hypothetical protein
MNKPYTYETDLFESDFEFGEIYGEHESDAPPWPQWPPGTRFKPQGGTIPSSPYGTSPSPPCTDATVDFVLLRGLLKNLDERLLLLRRLGPQAAGPLDPRRLEAQRLFNESRRLMRDMRKRVADGTYRRQGCGPREFAKLTCQMRTLHGFWCNSKELKKLRCELVFTLRQARGSYASTDCSRLGVALPKNWCIGHNCCCP